MSWRDLILLAGGLFLIGKSVVEMHKKLDEARGEHEAAHFIAGMGPAGDRAGSDPARPKYASFAWTIVTIAIIDIMFSLDSVITAIGMVEHVWVMVIAMVIAMLVMLYFAGPIGRIVEKHPTIKVLALSFLILIGVMLVAEGLGQHIDKGYIYAAMAFAVLVEMINMQLRGRRKRKTRRKSPPAIVPRGNHRPLLIRDRLCDRQAADNVLNLDLQYGRIGRRDAGRDGDAAVGLLQDRVFQASLVLAELGVDAEAIEHDRLTSQAMGLLGYGESAFSLVRNAVVSFR